jgi:histidinol phosphatase-like PHP family hydrolase
MKYIAITDHFTDSWKAGVIPTLRDSEKISEYLEEISTFQENLKQNEESLIVYKGIEVDLSSSEGYIKNLLPAEKFDIILFEYLQDLESIAFLKNLIEYWKTSITNIKKFPILGLAHFNPFYFLHGGLDILIQFLKNYNFYFEFNSSYPHCYSTRNTLFFEKLREFNIPVAIGCDSHHISNLNEIEEPLEMIRYYNLENNYTNLIAKLMQIEI